MRRGNETWAQTAAESLHASGWDVTLFGGARELDTKCRYIHIPNWPRDFYPCSLVSWHRRYLIEQRSFAFCLRRYLRQEHHDFVHVSDPALAFRLRNDLPRSGPRVIYKDGVLLGPPWCREFDFVQVLAPYYRDCAEAAGIATGNWFVIPHLVDTLRFSPAGTADRSIMRANQLERMLPHDGLVVLAVGDFSPASNKRLLWIVEEVARLLVEDMRVHLILVGQASPHELLEFRRQVTQPLGDRVHVVPNVPFDKMPVWYQVADVFVHAALREPFGIVFLEAMASGLPIIAHTFPVTEWIVGDAGCTVDMTRSGQLAGVLSCWHRDRQLLRNLGRRARERACSVFSAKRIIPLYHEMYRRAFSQP